jgi:thiol-disulfide isomerase/thioredoxin
MKKIFASIIAFASISCNAQEKQFSDESLKIKLLANDGKTQISFAEILKKHEGKTIVIEIWASWCGDCVKAMPLMKDLQAKNTTVDFVFLSMDKTAEKWLLGIEKHELKGDHYMANDGMKGVFGQAMNVDWIPRYIVVDKTGKVVLYRAIETDFEHIMKVLESVK